MTGRGKALAIEPGKGRGFRLGADRFLLKGGSRERADAFSVVEYEGAAGVPGPPPHVHTSFEEAWFILDGEVEFTLDDRTIRGTAGTYLFVPRGTPHAFQVVGAGSARWIGIFSPGRYVQLLVELSEVMPAAGPPDPEAIRRLFARFDTEIALPKRPRSIPRPRPK